MNSFVCAVCDVDFEHRTAAMVSLQDLKGRYGLTDELLRKECTREHLLEIGKTIDWRAVGQHLLSEVELSDINIEGHSEQLKRRNMLTKWKQKCS